MFGSESEPGPVFSREARMVLAMSRDEAMQLGHDYVGTEHILLGLTRSRDEPGILERFGLSEAAVRSAVGDAIRRGTATGARGELPYTSRSKKSLELALEYARRLGDAEVGPRHLLLGILAEEKNIAAQVLASRELTLDGALELISSDYTSPRAAQSEGEQPDLSDLLRPWVVAAYHRGATADQLRAALDRVIKDIFRA